MRELILLAALAVSHSALALDPSSGLLGSGRGVDHVGIVR